MFRQQLRNNDNLHNECSSITHEPGTDAVPVSRIGWHDECHIPQRPENLNFVPPSMSSASPLSATFNEANWQVSYNQEISISEAD